MSESQNPLKIPAYQRPVQNWTCGHVDASNPCPLGPNRLGVCQNPNDCQPIQEDGTYVCNRSPLQGGTCEEGPGPDGSCCHSRPTCTPVKSLRKRRGVLVFACVALTIGAFAFVLPQRWKNEVLAPGGLSHSHAQILSKDENRCNACHEAGEMNLISWVTHGFLGSKSDAAGQVERCLSCHKDSFEPTFAVNPHGVSSDLLASISKKQVGFNGKATNVSHNPNHKIACASCHREHHGSQHDLTKMSNQQCASCHQKDFHRFQDHPEFNHWPRPEQTSIAFDHKSHGLKYFPEAKTEFSCRSCHVESGTKVSAIVAYDRCGSCHDQKIVKTTDDGMVWMSLPMIDRDALERAGIDVGAWPEMATGDFEGELPVIMQAVLRSDVELQDALKVIGDDFDFMNIDSDNVDHLKAAGKIAIAIKNLIRNLAQNDPTTRQRVELALTGRANSSSQFTQLIPTFIFQTAESRWFSDSLDDSERAKTQPDSATESNSKTDASDESLLDAPEEDGSSEDHPDEQEDDLLIDDDDDLLTQSKSIGTPNRATEQQVVQASFNQQVDSQNGWYRDDDVFQIGYRPRKHADSLMKVMLSALADGSGKHSKELWAEFGSVDSSGQCATCHQRNEHGMQWQTPKDSAAKRGFTKFSHTPHLIQPELRDCKHCHNLDSNQKVNGSTTQGPHHGLSDFQSISKQTCITCHHPKAAGSGCVKCHNYHVHADVVPTYEARIRSSSFGLNLDTHRQ